MQLSLIFSYIKESVFPVLFHNLVQIVYPLDDVGKFSYLSLPHEECGISNSQSADHYTMEPTQKAFSQGSVSWFPSLPLIFCGLRTWILQFSVDSENEEQERIDRHQIQHGEMNIKLGKRKQSTRKNKGSKQGVCIKIKLNFGFLKLYKLLKVDKYFKIKLEAYIYSTSRTLEF